VRRAGRGTSSDLDGAQKGRKKGVLDIVLGWVLSCLVFATAPSARQRLRGALRTDPMDRAIREEKGTNSEQKFGDGYVISGTIK